MEGSHGAEYLRESGLGEDEFQRGKIGAAYTRFTRLLARIEALPEGAPLGPGSYEHCLILLWLARCLISGGHPDAAEDRLRKALSVIEALLSNQPENESYIRTHGHVLTIFADLLTDQGKYSQAREAYEAALEIAKQQGDLRSQGVKLGQLGTLAQEQHDYAKARGALVMRKRYNSSTGWANQDMRQSHGINWVSVAKGAEKMGRRAERCYRESLAIEEQLGNAAGAAVTCNALGVVARLASRPVVAEGWCLRGLELIGKVDPRWC